MAGILGVLLATNQPLALSNLMAQTAAESRTHSVPDSPVEREYHRILDSDDTAMADVHEWLRESEGTSATAGTNAMVERALLSERITRRLEPVKKDYEEFIRQHPDHARIHVAYGSFLTSIGHEELSLAEYETAIRLDPKLASAYNQAAMFYAHKSPVKKAFAYYEKAIDLEPNESLYYHSLGDVVFLFRKDSQEYYKLDEPQVFDKAMALYEKARQLDPEDFQLATDIAESYYIIKPFRTDAALKAWTNALTLASSELEREGIYLHLARVKLSHGDYAESHALLNKVTDEKFAGTRQRLLSNLNLREHPPVETNAPAVGTVKTNLAAK